MKIKGLIFLVTSLVLFGSCRKEVKYTSRTSLDNKYCIDIPSGASQDESNTEVMNFVDRKSDLFITIKRIHEATIDDYIGNNCTNTDDSFSYDLIQSSDTSSFYRITKGFDNLWSAYDLYMLKKNNGNNYIIKVSSDLLDKSDMINMVDHIYASMKQKDEADKATVTTSLKDKAPSLVNTYSKSTYSIKYPKQWQVLENLNDMTETYIGYKPENFGFTVVRFKTDETLSQIHADGNESVRQAGFKIIEDKQTKVDGVKCYRQVLIMNIKGQEAINISYTFKKDGMLYDFRFGSVTTKAQEALAAEIIKSFRFK